MVAMGVAMLKYSYQCANFLPWLRSVYLDAKRPVSFPFEDKHGVNERHVARKSHDATQKKCLHVGHFKVPRGWFETNLPRKKRYSEGGCRGLLGRAISLFIIWLAP